MRVLVTNDDGVEAIGLHVLARALVRAGYDVVVVAPRDDQSGASAALGNAYGEGIVVEEHALEILDGVSVYGIDGPPALSVMLGRLGAFGPPPDFIVAGINPGNNTGRAVLHSGTVGAALTAANFGISGLAVSQASGDPWLPETAAALAVHAFSWLVDAPRRTVLNLNTPNLPLDQVKGVRAARLAPFGTARAALADGPDGHVTVELRALDEPLAPDTDTMLVLEGYAAVTSLIGPRAVEDPGAAAALDAQLPAAAQPS